MYYVYILQSEKEAGRRYVGFSADLRSRVADHNSGKNVSTRNGKPWSLLFYAAFERKMDALAFEEYLKTASGKAFARKRLHPGRR